jgi:hypothetical protein
MSNQPQSEEIVRAFIEYYDDALAAIDAPRLTQQQRDVLCGLLDAMAMDDPRLVEVLRSAYEAQQWLRGKSGK